MTDVEIRLSGTIEALLDGERATMSGRRVSALLVVLALSAGRAVSLDALSRGIWGEDPPENVRGSLQTYVARLRGAIGTRVVTTERSGYRLDLSPAAVDLLRFEQLIAESADADTRDTEAARLDQALALWHGDPFGGAPSEWIEQQLVPELTERHLQAVERRIDLDLSDGNATAHLPMLRNLIERHPLRETLWMRLLTALDDAGRTAEALERYEDLRTRLADELGVDPSPELQRVHHGLLTKETAHTEPEPTAPRQLPPTVARFTGRHEQLTALDSILADGEAPVIALHGPGGVGKTALAVHWASRNHAHFPDGQLFVDLRGYGPGAPVEPLEALDTLLRGLGLSGSQIPADTESRSAMLRTELNGRRTLVILDNAREATQVRPMLAGGSTTTIVTSRSQLRGLVSRDGAQRIAVDPMPTDDAVVLLADRFGIRADSSTTELAELADLCGHLPVALTVAAERAGRDGHHRIAEVNERLRNEHERLATLTDWADYPLTDVRAVFSWSYEALDRDTARMFRLLGRHPHNRIATGAAAALGGIDGRTAERLLDRLTDRHLLTEVAFGWYEIHDLPHAYAAELATNDADVSLAAVRRQRSWYLHSVRNARYRLQPPRIEYSVPEPESGVEPPAFATAEQASAWLTAHLPGIRAMLDDASADGDDQTVARTTPYLYTYLRRSGAAREGVGLFATATVAARRTGDSVVEGTCTYLWGCCCELLADSVAALDHLERARDIFADLDHRDGRLNAEIAIGIALHELGRLDEATHAYLRALEQFEGTGSPVERATLLNNLATTYLELDRVPEALDAAQHAVELERVEDDETSGGLATTLVTLGEVQSAAKRWDDAISSFDDAVRILRETSHVSNEIVALRLRGIAHRELGDRLAADADWRTALARLEELGSDAVPDATAGELRQLLGSLPQTQ
ncbi:AfsR/SARP family transcriptional regulator [Solicola gregarius]|uniref:Tetratricopeptide repeat protein n=1 Tax=Solicola gregarius TaxID=2908642 RepID=A0AA46YKI8_9ACTN|nr:BTAD domain-containing putative transcriptional regulator [Solicola gregarius]UYM04511.1 tetratricopeptide repeat protein [Solicola gregarius]